MRAIINERLNGLNQLIIFSGILEFAVYIIVYLTFDKDNTYFFAAIVTIALAQALKFFTKSRLRFLLKINLMGIKSGLKNSILKKAFSKSATKQPHSNIKDLDELIHISEDCVDYLGESWLEKR